jgi:hypothetical protein
MVGGGGGGVVPSENVLHGGVSPDATSKYW